MLVRRNFKEMFWGPGSCSLLLILILFCKESQTSPRPNPQTHDRGYALSTGAPLITPLLPELTLAPDSEYYLHCEADEPITWIGPKDHPTTNVTTNDAERPYSVELHIEKVNYLDVGYFYCIKISSLDSDTYKDWTDSDYVELVNTDKASSIYIFVNDTTNLLVDPATPLFDVHQFSDVTIPCKPTMATTPVILIGPNQETYESESFHRYDPHLGFVLNIRGLTDGGPYNCLPKRPSPDNEEEAKYVFLKIMGNDYIDTKTDYINKPTIGSDSRGHSFVGGNFTLNCTLEVIPNVLFEMTWSHPPIDQNRLYITKAQKFASSSTNQVIGVTSLTVYNATKSDTGSYRCMVQDHSKQRSHSIYTMTILNNDTDTYINLTEPADNYNIRQKAHKLVKISVKYRGFPFPSIMWYHPNGMEIINSAKHKIDTTESTSTLQIANVTIMDSGIYKVKAKNNYLEKILNFTVKIDDKPRVRMESVYVQENEEAHMACTINAFPQPIATFVFTPCNIKPRWPSCDRKKDQTFNSTKKARPGSTLFETTFDLYFTPTRPGIMTCLAANVNGNSSAKGDVIIGDIGGNMTISGVEDNRKIARGDEIKLTCGALAYFFSDDLHWYKNYELVKETDDVVITANTTHYSYQKTLHFKNIQDAHRGRYECRGSYAKEDDKYESQYFDVFIHEPISPRMEYTNLDPSSKIKKKLGESLELQCKAAALPVASVEWYKDDELIESSDRKQVNVAESKLIIPLLYPEDDGYYKCVVSNRLGVIEESVQVVITNLPGLGIGWIILILVVFLILLLLVFYLFYRCRTERKALKELKKFGLANFQEGAIEHINPALALDQQADLLPYDKSYEFPKEKLKLGKQLGAGAFGVVLKAIAEGIKPDEKESIVAVKMFKSNADSEVVRALVSELKIMVHLGQHLNVVNLLGAVTKNIDRKELMVIVEYCCYGNVQNVLLRNRKRFINQINPETDKIDPTIMTQRFSDNFELNRNSDNDPRSGTRAGRPNSRGYLPRSDLYEGGGINTAGTEHTVMTTIPDDENMLSNNTTQPPWRSNYKPDSTEAMTITTSDLVSWAFQVARGMDYLASRKVLHGDLAARNILLCENNVVKICDFGLARSMYRSDNYKKQGEARLPIKWLALESLSDHVFSTYTDVWSFGIVLWEFFSLAKVPYPDNDANQSLFKRLENGYRMEKPPYANEELYDIMLACWSTNPESRPLFNVLEKKFAQMLGEDVTSHYVDLNEPYMRINTEYQRRTQTDYLALMGSPDEMAPAPPRYVNGHILPEIRIDPSSDDYIQTNVNEGTAIFSPTRPKDFISNDDHGKNDISSFDFSDIVPQTAQAPNSPTLANNLDMTINKNRKKIGIEATPEEIPMLHKTNLSDSEGDGDSPNQKRRFANVLKQTRTTPTPSPRRHIAETQLNGTTDENYVNVNINVNVKPSKNGRTIEAVSNPSYQILNKGITEQDAN